MFVCFVATRAVFAGGSELEPVEAIADRPAAWNNDMNHVHTVNSNKCKKTVVYLQLITAKWHIENSKNNKRW